jgi:uncharacterized membrane protein YfcA
MADLTTIVVITGTFLLAGTVKGVIGLGLPTISLGLLTVTVDLTTAMAFLIVPSFVTNLWQAVVGGHHRKILLRIWPFLTMATATVWLGATALTRLDLSFLLALLGVLLVAYSALNIGGVHLVISTKNEAWAGPLFGTANGLLTGMTGSFVVPGVMYLQGIGLPRDMLVQAMGMLFTGATLALALALHNNSLLTRDFGLISCAALIPATLGMIIGQRLRQKLTEARFRQVFFIGIFWLGIYIFFKAVLTLP